MYATYSPEDNKLRLYSTSRLDKETYERVRAAGFRWAPKQELFVAPAWTPTREDLLLDLCDDIEDEGYSTTEMAADRAERFSDYRDKRAAEARGFAGAFEAGPVAFGHQSFTRAERQARRHDRTRLNAVSQWSKAEYWQERTQGVIANALYRADPGVRRGRIKKLESEQRRFSHMSDRWKSHYERRLEYERAMLASEGGAASDVDMEPGGFLGNRQIHGVNRSNVTGKVVSVKLMGTNRKGETVLVSYNIERMPEGVYRAPTDEERAAFNVATLERRKAEKAARPKGPPLINPTDEDAERLQAIWNHQAKSRNGERAGTSTVARITQERYSAMSKGSYGPCETSEVSEQTTIRMRHPGDKTRVTVFKVRTASPSYGSGQGFYACRRVVVLTDKPQTPIPWDAVSKAKASQPTADKLFHRMGEIVKIACRDSWNNSEEENRLLCDAVYAGLAWSSSATQRGLTESGQEAFAKYREIEAEGGRITETGIFYRTEVAI